MIAHDSGASTFIGRSRELTILREQLGGVLSGEGRIVLVSGEPGIGKTRLCQEFRRELELTGRIVAWGRCFEGDWAPPLQPWVEVLDDLALHVGHDRLEELAGRERSLIARLVTAWRTEPGEPADSERVSGDDERFRLYDAMVQLLGRVSAIEPPVIVLDDLHWADHESIRLLSHLLRFIDRIPLLVIAAFRSTPLDRGVPLAGWLSEVHRSDHVASVPLAGLKRGELRRLMEKMLGSPADPDWLDAVVAGSVGNPFYASEMIRNAQWAGDAKVLFPPVASAPESIRETVVQRFERCSPTTRQLLSRLAIVSGGFRYDVAQAFLDLDDAALLDATDEGLRSGFLQVLDARTETYGFGHEIVRIAIADQWTPSRRVRLHRRLAESLERLYAGRERDHAAQIAVHYFASASLPGGERGIDHALAAARQAADRFARERVVSFLEMAQELAALHAPEREAEIVCRLALAQAEAIALEAAACSTKRGIELLRERGTTDEEVAQFIARAAAALKDNGAEPAVWQPLVRQGISLKGEQRDLTWARLTLLLERFTPITTRSILAARWEGIDEEALAIVRGAGDENDYARPLQPFQIRTRGETDSLREAIRAWRQPAAISRAQMMIGADLVYTHGAFRDAARFFDEMIASAHETGSIVTEGEAWVRLALVRYALGDAASAAEAEETARALVGRLPERHRLHASIWWVRAMRAELIDGDWEPVARYFSSFIADPARLDQAILLDDAALAALAQIRIGNVVEGRRLIQALTDALRKLDDSIWLLNGAVGVGASVVWELEEQEAAPVYADLAERLIARGIGDYPCCSNQLTVARMAALMGETERAARAFAQARDELERSGQEPLRATVDLDEARASVLAPAAGVNAGALLERAEAGFRRLEMPRRIGQIEAVRAQLAGVSGDGAPAGLTARELEIVRLMARGHSDRQISEDLFISPRTVHTHVRNMLTKTALKNRTELSVWAVEQGLVPR